MRKYKHWESFVTQECFLPEHSKMVKHACDSLAWLIDLSETIPLDSSCRSISEHPAFRAIVAIGEPALPWILCRLSDQWDEKRQWWEVQAAQGILRGIEAEPEVPRSIHGRIRELRIFFRRAILDLMDGPHGRVKFYAETEPMKPTCKCGKPGKWIADGVCRFGFYCRRCSNKAMEDA